MRASGWLVYLVLHQQQTSWELRAVLAAVCPALAFFRCFLRSYAAYAGLVFIVTGKLCA